MSTAGGVTVTNLTASSGTSPANVAVQADLSLTTGQYAGLVTRYSGPTDKNMYVGGIVRNPSGTGFVAAIWVNNAAGWARVTGFTVIGGGQGTLYFETVGSSLQLFWKAAGAGTFKLVSVANDSSLKTGTAGVRIGPGVTLTNVTSTAISTANASLTFTEDFTAANYPTTFGSEVSDFWQNQVGAVAVANGAASSQSSLNVATLNGVNIANEYAQADITVHAGQYAGLVTRYQGTGDRNMYFGEVVAKGAGLDACLWVNRNGVWTPLTTLTPIAGTGQGTLLFVAIGSSLQLFWQPTGVTGFSLVASATNASLSTGSVGVRIGSGATLTSFKADVATPQTPQNATLTFTEDFTSPSYPAGLGSQLSSFWKIQVGDVSNVNANAVGQTSLNVATLNGVNVADVTVQATVNVPHGKFVGLVARNSGAGDRNMYFADISSSGSGYVASIWINVNGVWTRLTPLTSIGNVGQGTLEFKIVGSSLQLFWNNALIVSTTNTRLTTGSVGMRIAQGAELANFSAG